MEKPPLRSLLTFQEHSPYAVYRPGDPKTRPVYVPPREWERLEARWQKENPEDLLFLMVQSQEAASASVYDSDHKDTNSKIILGLAAQKLMEGGWTPQ